MSSNPMIERVRSLPMVNITANVTSLTLGAAGGGGGARNNNNSIAAGGVSVAATWGDSSVAGGSSSGDDSGGGGGGSGGGKQTGDYSGAAAVVRIGVANMLPVDMQYEIGATVRHGLRCPVFVATCPLRFSNNTHYLLSSEGNPLVPGKSKRST